MAYSATEYNNEYIKTKKDRINFVMPRGYKEIIRSTAEAEKISVSEFIRRAIENELNRCGVSVADNWKRKDRGRTDQGGAE